jgi:NADH-ubiquinone oxidoreductase chain 5
MSAPTPVSSLVHSSTLVTAGLYVLIRYNYVFFFNFFLFKVVSLLTMFFSGLVALFECDFKKVVAMSTLSQMGIIFFVVCNGM